MGYLVAAHVDDQGPSQDIVRSFNFTDEQRQCMMVARLTQLLAYVQGACLLFGSQTVSSTSKKSLFNYNAI